jgi:anti-sigma B factor antagonist
MWLFLTFELMAQISGDMFWSTRMGDLSLRAWRSCQQGPLFDEVKTTMALNITCGEVNGVAVVWLDGRIVLGEETVVLREKVKGLLGEGKKKLVLDLKNITFIDSSGLGALVAAHTSAKSSGATLRLCNLGTRNIELLQMTRLLTVFEVSNSEAEAVSFFSK